MTLYAYYTGSYRSPEEAIKNAADYYIEVITDDRSLFFYEGKIMYDTTIGELCTVLNACENTLTVMGLEGELGYFVKKDDKCYIISNGEKGVIPL